MEKADSDTRKAVPLGLRAEKFFGLLGSLAVFSLQGLASLIVGTAQAGCLWRFVVPRVKLHRSH